MFDGDRKWLIVWSDVWMFWYHFNRVTIHCISFLLTSPRRTGKKRLLWFCQKREGVVLEPLQVKWIIRSMHTRLLVTEGTRPRTLNAIKIPPNIYLGSLKLEVPTWVLLRWVIVTFFPLVFKSIQFCFMIVSFVECRPLVCNAFKSHCKNRAIQVGQLTKSK